MADYPHRVVIQIDKTQFVDLLAWLRDHNHELRKTMCFGSHSYVARDDHISQIVLFKEAQDAMLFKLAWGGL